MPHLKNMYMVYICVGKKRENNKVPSSLSNILVPDPIIPKALIALAFSVG